MDLIEPDTSREWDIRFARLALHVMSPHLSRDAQIELEDLLPDREAFLDRLLGKDGEE